jgi:hypothetical protein
LVFQERVALVVLREEAVIAERVGAVVSGAGVTEMVTLLVAVVYTVPSVGVKVVERVWEPTERTVPLLGLYRKVPGTEAVAVSWVAESGVPKEIAEGVFQERVGVALVTEMVTSSVAVAPSLSVTVKRKMDVPAASAVMVVEALLGAVMEPLPETLVQWYVEIEPSESVALPERVTEEVGAWID